MQATPSLMSFISQIFLVKRRAITSDQRRSFEPICVSRTLKDGGSTPFTIPNPTGGLDGENGFERSLLPNPNPLKPLTHSPIHLGGEALQVSMSPIWSLRSITNFYKTTEISGGLLKADRLRSNSVSG